MAANPTPGFTPTFTRPPRSSNFRPVTSLYEIQFKRLLLEISTAAERAVNKTANMALRTADARVPVRKVFKGGRQTKRRMTISELQREGKQFARASGLSVLEYRRLHKMHGVPTFRLRTEVVTHQNKANRWRDTAELRAIKRDESGQWRLAKIKDDGTAEIRSDVEEQYLLRQMRGSYTERTASGKLRLKLRDADVHSASGRQGFIGGSLKNSLMKRVDTQSATLHKMSIVAGGPRAPYAKFVEFGTRRTPAQPYLRPAMKTAELRYRQIMHDELGKIGKAG